MNHINKIYPVSVAYGYLEKCLHDLRPIHTNPDAKLDENLFAATIILRVLEEMDGLSCL